MSALQVRVGERYKVKDDNWSIELQEWLHDRAPLVLEIDDCVTDTHEFPSGIALRVQDYGGRIETDGMWLDSDLFDTEGGPVWYVTSMNALCERCRKPLGEHPLDPRYEALELRIACSGWRVRGRL